MAYDIQIPTPRGTIGLNVSYLQSSLGDTVIQAWLLQDGAWVYKGHLSLTGAFGLLQIGSADAIIAKMLVDEGLATTANVTAAQQWIGSRSQESAMNTIMAWVKRLLLEHLVPFLNRVIGVVPGQPSNPGPAPTTSFASCEHALRTAIKALPFKVDPNTSEISI